MSLPKDPASQLGDGGGASGSFGDGDPREGSREIHDGIIVSEAMDWCKKDGAIVPYRLWAKQLQAGQLANSVRQTDDRSHVEGSLVLVSHGDAPGAFGITSGTHNAECTPMTWSATVRAEGRNMVRHDDLWWMNHKNTYGRLPYVKDRNSYPTPDPQLVKAKMQVAQAATGTMSDAAPAGVDAPSIPSPGTAVRTVGGALATPEAAGVAGGTALGGVAAGVGLIGISRGNAIVEDAGRAQVGLPPQTRTPIMGLPLNPDLSATGARAPVLPRTDSIVRTTAQQREDQKKCPCTVEPYSVQRTKCPTECEGSQAHHIVPDYLLGPDNRAKREQGSRIYTDKGDPLTSFQDGPSICLIGNKSTAGTPHNIAHGGDRQIQDEAAGNSGVTSLGQAVDISVLNAIEARPECKGEILAKTYDEFGKFDENTNVRGTNNPIKPDSPASGKINIRPSNPGE